MLVWVVRAARVSDPMEEVHVGARQLGGERLHVVTLTCLCVCVWPTPCLHMQPQENCNADVLIGKFLLDARQPEEEEEGEEMAEQPNQTRTRRAGGAC